MHFISGLAKIFNNLIIASGERIVYNILNIIIFIIGIFAERGDRIL